jgi:murein DD-endopeptidase MepM/ murein hydrolase activator NlpD
VAATAAGGAGLALPLLVAAAPSAAGATPAAWNKVAQCESGQRWNLNTGNGFYGGLQFAAATWKAYGGERYAPRADEATKAEQIAVAERVLASQGPTAWPICSQGAGLTRSAAVDAGAHKSAPKKKSTAHKSAPRKSAKSANSTKSTTEKSAAGKSAHDAGTAKKKTTAAKSAKGAHDATYTVRGGDNLSEIAEHHDVKGGWPRLYDANRSVVGSDPDLILPGQRLDLPSGWAPAHSTAKPAEKPAAKPAAKSTAHEATEHSAPVRSESTGTTHAKPASDTARHASYVLPVADAPLGTPYEAAGSLWSSGRHTGQDFLVPTGTSVRAVTDGTVVTAGWGGAYGYQVVLRHPDGMYTQYGHLSAITVKVGQHVRTGQRIGRSGATGNATGPHLHFEVRTGPEYGSDVNPLAYLRKHGVKV